MLSVPLWIAAGLIGPCLGSFVATAALRRTTSEQVAFGRSHCDHCGVALSYVSTVPVLSYIRLRGACQACGARIDASHLIGEIVGGVILLSALAAASPPRAGLLAALGLTLLASSVHDLKTQRLPDSFTAVVAGCAAALAWLQSEQTFWLGLVCACTAFVALEAMRRSFIWLRRKPGLGFGDVKLVTALALWLGLATPWAVALASLMGLAAALRQPAERRLAFGPWIAVAAWCVGLAGEARLWPSLT